ncbi:MAG TPA: hypothetical protein VGK19_15150 [Capsulimonadaceae bacterium]|jgi:hypothetical protein
MRNPFSSRIRATDDFCALVLLAAVTVGAFWPWLFTGQAFYWGDIGLYFAPMAKFLQSSLRSGHIPLWNPELLCGTPFAGNPQMSVLYPATALLPFVEAHRYIMLVNVSSIFLAGLFMYRYLTRGRLRLWWVPGVFGAIIYMLGGFAVSKAQFPNMLAALAFVPLCLLQAERLVRNPGIRVATYLGIAFAVQLYAAHAQITMMTVYLCGLVALAAGKWWRSPKSLISRIWWFAVAAFVGVGLTAAYTLPVAQLWTLAARQELTLSTANRFCLYFAQLTNIIWPDRFGNPMFGNFAPEGAAITFRNYWEAACYVGIAPALMVAFTPFVLRRERKSHGVAFWLAVTLVGLWLSFGEAAGLYTVAYYCVPGLKAFHDPARLLLLPALGFAVVAAIVLNRIMFRPKRRQALVLLFATVLIAVTAVDLARFDRQLYPMRPIAEIDSAPKKSRLASALISDPILKGRTGRVMMVDSNRPWAYFTSYRDFRQKEDGFMARWMDTAAQNLMIGTGVMEGGGYEPFGPKVPVGRFYTVRNSLPFDANEAGKMAVNQVIAFRPKPLPETPKLQRVKAFRTRDKYNNLYYYKNLAYLPRIRFVDAKNGKVANPQLNGTPEIVSDRPNELVVAIPVSALARTLVIADSYYPGWTGSLDGEMLPIWSTGDGFRKLRIPDTVAPQVLTLSYKPFTFALGLYITLSVLSLVCARLCVDAVRGRQQRNRLSGQRRDSGWLFPNAEPAVAYVPTGESVTVDVTERERVGVLVGAGEISATDGDQAAAVQADADGLVEWRPGDFLRETQKLESHTLDALREPKKRFKPMTKERSGRK